MEKMSKAGFTFYFHHYGPPCFPHFTPLGHNNQPTILPVVLMNAIPQGVDQCLQCWSLHCNPYNTSPLYFILIGYSADLHHKYISTTTWKLSSKRRVHAGAYSEPALSLTFKIFTSSERDFSDGTFETS